MGDVGSASGVPAHSWLDASEQHGSRGDTTLPAPFCLTSVDKIVVFSSLSARTLAPLTATSWTRRSWWDSLQDALI